MTSKMFTARKNHTTVAITSTLKSFCRSRTVTFIYTSYRTRHIWDKTGSNDNGHVRVLRMIRILLLAVMDVEKVSACGQSVERIRGGSVRGFALHRNRALEKETTFIYRCLINKTN
jgi:hypothetical protein